MRGNLVDYMNTSMTWLPVMLTDDPHTRMKKFAALSGPAPDFSVDYWVDMGDLFLYGYQFTNFATSSADGTANVFALPQAGVTNRKYPSSTDVDALFAAAAPANLIRQDGVVQLTIAGTVVDMSAPT